MSMDAMVTSSLLILRSYLHIGFSINPLAQQFNNTITLNYSLIHFITIKFCSVCEIKCKKDNIFQQSNWISVFNVFK